LSAFFSGAETALTAASRRRMHTLEVRATSGRPWSTGCGPIMEQVIGAVLLGNNMINILASAMAPAC